MDTIMSDDDSVQRHSMKIILDKYVRDGNLPEAIKWYRKLYGSGLKEAKESVEALMAGKPTYEELEAKVKALTEQVERLLPVVRYSQSFARSSFTMVSSTRMVYIPFEDWDKFRDAMYKGFA